MALNAGANIILHPSNPEKIIDYLSSRWDEIRTRVEESVRNIVKVKEDLNSVQRTAYSVQRIGAKAHWETAKELTQKSIKIIPKNKTSLFCHAELDSASKETLKQACPEEILNRVQNDTFRVQGDTFKVFSKQIVVLIIDEDNNNSGKPFVDALKKRYKKIKTFYFDNNSQLKNSSLVTCHSSLIIAVFSKISAWKGRSGLSMKLRDILKKAIRNSSYSVLVGFCSPYLLRGDLKADATIEAYSDSVEAQEAAAKVLVP